MGAAGPVPDLAGPRLSLEVEIPGAGTCRDARKGPVPLVREVKGLQEVSRSGRGYCLCEVRGSLT